MHLLWNGYRIFETHFLTHRQSISKVSPSTAIGGRFWVSFTTGNGCSNSQLAGCCCDEQHEYCLSESAAGGKHGRWSSVSDGSGLQLSFGCGMASFVKSDHSVLTYIPSRNATWLRNMRMTRYMNMYGRHLSSGSQHFCIIMLDYRGWSFPLVIPTLAWL